jgi:hypothetical protein
MVKLESLATEINAAHALVEGYIRAATPHAVRAGELLEKAKASIPHGEWVSWLEKNCTFSERTAQTYMRLARELPKLDPAKAQRVADLPLREAMRELAEHCPEGSSEISILQVHEKIIEKGLPSLREAGNALIKIRDGRLYRGTHDTFEAFCDEKWNREYVSLVIELTESHPKYEYHPFSMVIPEFTGAGYESLKESIRERGLLVPIWLYEGKILDGRARYRACVELGIAPAFRECDGDPVGLLYSMNLMRKHRTEEEMAAGLAAAEAMRKKRKGV